MGRGFTSRWALEGFLANSCVLLSAFCYSLFRFIVRVPGIPREVPKELEELQFTPPLVVVREITIGIRAGTQEIQTTL